MKRKRALAMAITLSLLLANHVSAVELMADSSLSQFQDDGNGLMIYPDVTFDGENGDLNITGTVSGENAIDCIGNGEPFYFGLQNEGVLENVKALTTDTIINYSGTMSVGDITITKTGNDAFFMNYGEGANATINGSIYVDSAGWVNNTEGAVMTLNGKDAVIGAELANDYGATLNINADTTINMALWNVEGATLNIADDVTVTTAKGFANAFNGYEGGIVNAGKANIIVTGSSYGFSNSSTAEIGSVTVSGWLGAMNSGQLTVNNKIDAKMSNSGDLTYNGTEAINGNLTNSGTIYATEGILKVNGDLSMSGKNSSVWKNTDKDLTDIEVSNKLTVDNSYIGQSTLNAGNVEARLIYNKGNIIADKLVAKERLLSYYVENGESSIDVNELVLGNYVNSSGNSLSSIIGTTPSGTIHYGNSVVRVHEKLVFDSSNGVPILENRDRLFLDGNAVVIEGNGKIVNQEIYTYWSGTSIGVIAKNENKEAIENLTINSELVNQGELYVKNLSVLKGVDGIEQADGSFKESHAFDVENLNILDSGSFELKKDNYTFTSVGVGAHADLTAAGSLTVNDAMALQDGASVETLSEGENNFISAGSLSVGDGGSITTGVITVSKNELDGSTTTGSVITGTGSTITADTLTAAGDVSIGGAADISENIQADSLTISQTGTVKTQAVDVTGAMSVSGTADITDNIKAGALAVGQTGTVETQTVDVTGAMSVSGTASITDNIKAGALAVSQTGTVETQTVDVTGAMSVDGIANISTSIDAGSLTVGDGGSIFNIDTNGNVTAVPAIDVQKDISLGAKADVTAGTITSINGSVITGTDSTITADTLSAAGNVSVNGTADVSERITTSSLIVGNGSSVTTATLNLNGNADEGKGTITLGGAITNADGTQKAAALNVANGITANALTSAAGSVITVGADKDIEIAGALELGGAAAANKITAATLATGADSELTANTLEVTDAVIGGKATVNVEMTATGSVDVNTAGSLTAETMNVDGALTLIKADSEEGGAYVKIANGLTAGAVGIGDYGILEAGSVDADGSISLGDGASAAIEGDVVAKTLVAADESNINAENVIASEGVGLGAGVTANVKNIIVSEGALSIGNNSELTAGVVTASEGISLGAGVTANVNDITVRDGALVVEDGSALTASAVDVSGSVIFGDKVNAEVTSLTADAFGVGNNSILAAASVNVDGVMSVGEGASAEITNTVAAGALGVATGGSLFADVVMVDEAMSLGEGASATVTKGVEAGALGIASGGSLFADVIMVDEAMSLGAKANVTVTNDIMAKMLTALDGSSIKADDVTASEGISLGAGVTANVKDITVSEGALSIGDNSELTAGVVTVGEGIGLGAGVMANVKDITVSSGSLLVEKESTLTASAVDVSGSVIFGDTVNIKAADITAKELAVGGSSSFTAQNLHVDTEIDLGAGVDANVNDVTAGLLYVQNGGAITANDINVQSLGFANNVTAKANNAIANDLLAGQESVISMQDVKVTRTLNLGERTYMSVNDVQKAQSIVLNDEAVLNARNVQDTQNITLEDGASLSAVNVDKVQNIVLDSKAAMSADAITMSDEASITSSGGNIKTDALTGGSLAFNLLTKETEQIYVGNLTSDSLTVNVNDLTEKQVVIGNYTGGDVSVIGNGSVTDSFGNDMPSIEEGMQKLADTLQINGNEDMQLVAAEGSVLGEITGTVYTDGSLTVTGEKVNSFNQGISEMASIALMTWRQENNDMNKRLGELRDSTGEHGVWVRMTRGESKYGAQNIKNQYNSYQLGYDEKLSVDKHWTVGAALTYTDADSSFRGGKGENKHKGLAVYGSRLNDDGSFIDLIARYARLEHDFEVRGGAGKGDFDTNGYSLSAEYGKRFTQKSGLWFEPQAELTYGRVGSASYLTDKGVRVRQEGMDSLVGRLGFALGQNLAKGKGNVYLRASYLYDFEGETDVRFANPTQNRSFKQDLGDGWWEVGVGANVNISKAAHLYFDVEKTYGGNVATPWQWNAGLRWSF